MSELHNFMEPHWKIRMAALENLVREAIEISYRDRFAARLAEWRERAEALLSPPSVREEPPTRCLVTGNICGTDTWEIFHPCECINCQKWLSGAQTAKEGKR